MLYEAIYFPSETDKLQMSIVDEPWLSKYVENFGRKGDFSFVLVEQTELVGAVWSRLFTEDKAGYGFIDEKTPEFSIAISERFRNQGFGALMIQNLIEKLISEGFEKLSLSVDKRSPAQNLYRRLGFEIIREDDTAFTMLKKL
jgi:ribosomal protein S18 acetylase RimI-like enzyme